MTSQPASGNEAADEALLSGFAAAHGCPRGCPACAHARAQFGVPALLNDWKGFVTGRAGLRVTLLCKRSGRAFPRFTNDEVVQFCIEEALHERAYLLERRSEATLAATSGGDFADLDVGSPAGGSYGNYDPAHAEALAKARSFAEGGEA